MSRLIQQGADPTIICHRIGGEKFSSLGYAILKDRKRSAKMTGLLLSVSHCDPDSIVCHDAYPATEGTPRLPSRTALLLAIEGEDLSTMNLLIRYGARVNLPTRYNTRLTPLQKASEIGNIEIVKLLIQHGAELNAPPAKKRGGTALQLAVSKGFFSVLELLLRHGADLDAPGSQFGGLSALERASKNGRLDVVRYLLNVVSRSKIVRVNQVRSSVSLAKDNGHIPLSELLAEYLEAPEFRDVPEVNIPAQNAFSMVHSERPFARTSNSPRVSDWYDSDNNLGTVDWNEFTNFDGQMLPNSGTSGDLSLMPTGNNGYPTDYGPGFSPIENMGLPSPIF